MDRRSGPVCTLWRTGSPTQAGSKPEMALQEVDRLLALRVRFGTVIADAGYGLSSAFRQGLSERGLSWTVGILCTQTVYSTGVELTWPVAKTGRPRQRAVASERPVAAETMLRAVPWHRVSWRRGTKGRLCADFAALRVRGAEGPPQCDGTPRPGEGLWLVGERRASGEHKYYLSNLPAETPLSVLAARIKTRWVCEQGHQQMKEELGLDHFEGRSWQSRIRTRSPMWLTRLPGNWLLRMPGCAKSADRANSLLHRSGASALGTFDPIGTGWIDPHLPPFRVQGKVSHQAR